MELRKLFFVLLILELFLGSPAHAVELCLAIDGSGSIDLADFNIQLEGLASAIEDPTVVPQNGTVILSVVQFSTSAVLEVSPTLIDSQTTANDFAAQIRGIYQQIGSTNISAAINVCMNAFSDPQQKWIIDISSDGVPNYVDSECEALYNRDRAFGRGLDVLNALGIGNFVQNVVCNSPFLEQLVWPQPASPLFEDGFVIALPDFSEYEDAIRLKLQEEIKCLPEVEICDDEKDNDCDGLVDCDDPDCTDDPACIECVPEICDDEKDNDCDGLIDCDDPDCTDDPACIECVPEICDDEKDNDCDGLIDCDDPDCTDDPACIECVPEICDDEKDNDCDGLVDCDDPDCTDDPACIECVPEICDDEKDNDCDGLIDCDDPDCTDDPACIECVPEICDDEKDNDCDGLVDCDDPDCTDDPACITFKDIVYIDIKPGSCPNPMRLKCSGVLPVAILGTNELDVSIIDPETVMITREGIVNGVPLIRFSYEDVGTPYEGELCECHALRKDGYLDLTMKFMVADVVEELALDEFEDRESIPLTIVGETYDGTPVSGEDCIWIIGNLVKECNSDLDCDADIDGTDAAMFKQEFGRRNCNTSDFCIADFQSDGDVDGSDALTFKSEFGTKLLW